MAKRGIKGKNFIVFHHHHHTHTGQPQPAKLSPQREIFEQRNSSEQQ
jgi:hypothetical protein